MRSPRSSRRWLRGTREWRDKAHEFLSGIDARGGTELAAGFLQAAAILKDGGGDVLILTDGQVAGTEKILADARSGGVRLHCLGIGSASQDRFLALLARESGGVSRFVTANERVDLAAVELFASIGRPVATGLKAGANIQPEPASQVISGTPVLLFGEGESIELSWDGGRLMLPVEFGDGDIAETVWLLQGSRLITDWESRYPAVNAQLPLEKRKQNRVAGRLLSLSQTYGLASREMSLVAVVRRPGDRAGELPETRVVPVGMAQDVSMDAHAYFQSMSFASATAFPSLSCAEADLTWLPLNSSGLLTLRINLYCGKRVLPCGCSRGKLRPRRHQRTFCSIWHHAWMPMAVVRERTTKPAPRPPQLRCWRSCHAGSHVDPSGRRIPGATWRCQVSCSCESLSTLPDRRREVVAAVIAMVRKGVPVAGEWLTLARASGDHWRDVEALVAAV